MIRVLVACECSGRVREALRRRGVDAWSCDLKPAEDGSPFHHEGDVLDFLRATKGRWGGMIAHPDCTYLTNAGVLWFYRETSNPNVVTGAARWAELEKSVAFYLTLRYWQDVPVKIIENPVMHKHARERIQFPFGRQVVQPWWFGDPYFKATGLELIGVEPLRPTKKLTPPKKGTPEHKAWSAVHRCPPGADRKTERSRTYPGLADALADAMCRALGIELLAAAYPNPTRMKWRMEDGQG